MVVEQIMSTAQFQLQHKIFINMDQAADLLELNVKLRMSENFTTDLSDAEFNFSETTALQMMQEFVRKQYTLEQPHTLALICLYVPVFLLSLAGNLLVMFVVFRNSHMRRVKNLFLVNLAMADMAVTLLCIPLVAGQIVFRLWIYGTFMCKLSGYMQGVAVTASIFTLTALSIDRYVAIKAPLSMRQLNGRVQAAKVIISVWFLAGVFVSPMLWVRQVYTMPFEGLNVDVSFCIEQWEGHRELQQAYSLFLLASTYLAPIAIITVCYSMIGKTLCSGELHRKTSDSSSTVMLGRKRVARMLMALIAVFVLCWLPYNICSLSLDLNLDFRDAQILPFTLWMGHAHSAVNPFIYWFLNKSFRNSMRKALTCRGLRNGRKDSPSPHSPGGDLGDLLGLGALPLNETSRLKPRRNPGDAARERMLRLQTGLPYSLDPRYQQQQQEQQRPSSMTALAGSTPPSPPTSSLRVASLTLNRNGDGGGRKLVSVQFHAHDTGNSSKSSYSSDKDSDEIIRRDPMEGDDDNAHCYDDTIPYVDSDVADCDEGNHDDDVSVQSEAAAMDGCNGWEVIGQMDLESLESLSCSSEKSLEK